MSPPAIVKDAIDAAKRGSKRTATAMRDAASDFRNHKRRMETEKCEHDIIASLWQNKRGHIEWNKLSDKNKRKKAHVLAVLSSNTTTLPLLLTESMWNSTPLEIRDDRDILLARLTHPKFDKGYYKNHDFVVPESLRRDKEVVIAVLRVCPKAVEQVKDSLLLRDQDMLCAYLDSEQVKTFPVEKPIADLLSKFSLSLRSCPKRMLQAAKTNLGSAVLLHCSKKLLNEFSFASSFVAQVDKIADDSLGHFSLRLRTNPFIALAFVKKNGRCLKDVAKSLREKTIIVREACQNDPTALSFCRSSQVRKGLGQDKTFMLNKIFERLPRAEGDHTFYEMLPPTLKVDHEIVVAAYKANCLSIDHLPSDLTADRNFWTFAIPKYSMFWYGLPLAYSGDPDFARHIVTFASPKLVKDVFARFSFLAEEKSVWNKIVQSDPEMFEDALCQLIDVYAPEGIRQDEEIMTAAREIDIEVLEHVHIDLWREESFAKATMEDSHFDLSGLFWFPKQAQRHHPHLIAKIIQDESIHESFELDEALVDVAEELWENLDVCEAWFKVGGWFHSLFPATATDNEQFGLIVAKYGGNFDDDPIETTFKSATSEKLRSNKEFMMKAVEIDHIHYLTVHTDELQRDFDLAVVALSGPFHTSRRIVIEMLDRDDDNFGFFLSVRKKANELLLAYDGVTKGLNRGMSEFAGPGCHLRMLVIDPETTTALKMRIAAILGMPAPEKVSKLRMVAANLRWLSLRTLGELYEFV